MNIPNKKEVLKTLKELISIVEKATDYQEVYPFTFGRPLGFVRYLYGGGKDIIEGRAYINDSEISICSLNSKSGIITVEAKNTISENFICRAVELKNFKAIVFDNVDKKTVKIEFKHPTENNGKPLLATGYKSIKKSLYPWELQANYHWY